MVVSARSPVALAEALQKLSDDADLRTRFGDAGRVRQEEKFSLSACVDAYEGVYRKCSDLISIKYHF